MTILWPSPDVPANTQQVAQAPLVYWTNPLDSTVVVHHLVTQPRIHMNLI